MIDKKQLILKILSKEIKLSTTKISVMIKSSYTRALQLLNELKEEKKVKMNKELMGFSWSLK